VVSHLSTYTSEVIDAASHSNTQATVPECKGDEGMAPYILHHHMTLSQLRWFAGDLMVVRNMISQLTPEGTPSQVPRLIARPVPGNTSACTPQNLAWLSGIHHAQKSIPTPSPTLNAQPVIPALLDAVKRGVEVRCYLSQGYNDAVSSP
jgi:hypothetical protein